MSSENNNLPSLESQITHSVEEVKNVVQLVLQLTLPLILTKVERPKANGSTAYNLLKRLGILK